MARPDKLKENCRFNERACLRKMWWRVMGKPAKISMSSSSLNAQAHAHTGTHAWNKRAITGFLCQHIYIILYLMLSTDSKFCKFNLFHLLELHTQVFYLHPTNSPVPHTALLSNTNQACPPIYTNVR